MTQFENALETLDARIDADICVVGSGAAGLTVARQLAAAGRRVLLVEAGGERIEAPTQSLYRAGNTGLAYYDLAACRLRYWGGTTNHWSGYCRANDPIDYEGRPAIGLPPWPIDHRVLAPHLDRAAALLGISARFFDPAAQLRSRGLDPAMLVDHRSQLLVTKNFQIARDIRLGTRFRPAIAADSNIRPIEHLNVVEIRLGEGRRVEHLRAATINGRQTEIHAHSFVLCCHAIENARLLLDSDRQMAGGIGNQGDHVGRYFMEHAHITAGRMIPSDRFPQLYNRLYLLAHGLNANLGFSEAALRREGILNYYCRFNPRFGTRRTGRIADRFGRDLKDPLSGAWIDDLRGIMADLPAVGKRIERLFHEPQPLWFDLEHRIEQAPNPDSRVTLTDRRNRLGQREVELHWALSDLDIKTFNVGQRLIARELSALQMGRFEVQPVSRDDFAARLFGNFHHTGTTRMAARPEDGVVDADLKVHGIDNLYIGGSSVFPTAGYSGPTMMIIALAYRLAEHLAPGRSAR
jgi:choline dehydrogenase-like flavoprotein